MPLQLFVRSPAGALRAVAASPEDAVAAACCVETADAAGRALRIVHEGRTLDPRASLAAARVRPWGTLELLPRLRGGGGDGGSTGAESRSCYLEMYAGKKRDKVNPEEERLARWTTCQLSGMPLHPPCVADELGSLFNKDAVLQALVTKSMPKPLGHISSLKHLIELKLEAAAGSGGGQGGEDGARFACPISGQAFNGKYKFVIFRKSGHVLSERALKEVPAVVEEMVGGKWEASDLLPVNPSGEELQQMREALLLKRTAERAAKKEKKKDKAAAAAAAVGGGSGEPAEVTAAGGKRAAENGDAAAAAAKNGVNGAPAAAAAGAKRFKAAELKPKGADDNVWNSLFTSSTSGSGGNDYMCRSAMRRVA